MNWIRWNTRTETRGKKEKTRLWILGGSVGYIYSTVRAGNDGHGVWTCMGTNRVAETGNRMGGITALPASFGRFCAIVPVPRIILALSYCKSHACVRAGGRVSADRGVWSRLVRCEEDMLLLRGSEWNTAPGGRYQRIRVHTELTHTLCLPTNTCRFPCASP